MSQKVIINDVPFTVLPADANWIDYEGHNLYLLKTINGSLVKRTVESGNVVVERHDTDVKLFHVGYAMAQNKHRWNVKNVMNEDDTREESADWINRQIVIGAGIFVTRDIDSRWHAKLIREWLDNDDLQIEGVCDSGEFPMEELDLKEQLNYQLFRYVDEEKSCQWLMRKKSEGMLYITEEGDREALKRKYDELGFTIIEVAPGSIRTERVKKVVYFSPGRDYNTMR